MEIIIHYHNQIFVLLKNLFDKRQHRDLHNLYIAQQCVHFCLQQLSKLALFQGVFWVKKNMCMWNARTPQAFALGVAWKKFTQPN